MTSLMEKKSLIMLPTRCGTSFFFVNCCHQSSCEFREPRGSFCMCHVFHGHSFYQVHFFTCNTINKENIMHACWLDYQMLLTLFISLLLWYENRLVSLYFPGGFKFWLESYFSIKHDLLIHVNKTIEMGILNNEI